MCVKRLCLIRPVSLDPSHVLLALGLPHEIAHGSLRLTLSEETTLAEIDFVVRTEKNHRETSQYVTIV